MKFSRRVHYGLVFLLQLHYIWPGHKAVKELADAGGLPRKFLESIASDFRKGGFVEVRRGSQGGYLLARPLKEITLLNVLRCLDPEWERQTTETGSGKPAKQETVQRFLTETSQSVDRVFDEITLDALPAMSTEDDNLMYYI
ncbi:MAG: RrF2 family transcriptional regulator [Marinilabiliaceae bacterium]